MSIAEHSHDAFGSVKRSIPKVSNPIANPVVMDTANAIMKKLNEFKKYATMFLNTYTWIIFIIILVFIIKYYLYQFDKEEGNLNSMTSDLEIYNPTIRPIAQAEYDKNIPIRDYYVMSSYNSCAGGDSWNDWVDKEVLRKVIGLGVRCLDLEIYFKNGECIVSVGPESSDGTYTLKGTYNSLTLEEALQTIDTHAFSSSYTPNSEDPLFINLRIKTNKPEVYNKIAEAILNPSIFRKEHRIQWDNGKIVNGKYQGSTTEMLQYTAFANLYKRYYWKGQEAKNIIDEPLSFIKGKAVFICNDNPTNSFWGEWNDNYIGENKSNNYTFMSCINISNVIGNCRPLRSFKVVYAHNAGQMKDDLKRIMGVSYPDITTTGKNPNWLIHSKYGAQFTLMNFSNRDAELISYLKNFHTAKKAFITKPRHLRYFAIPLKTPKPQKKENSFGERPCNPDIAFIGCV
jgi:hypothetical protein